MSKSRKPTGIAWGEASDELKAKVKLVLQMAQNNRYSVSRIYAAHNAVFGLKEQPETCSTCLTSREKNLRAWWADNAQEGDKDARQPVIVEGVATTGEKHHAEATDYEGVVDKYAIKFPQGEDADEAAALANFIAAGVGTKKGLKGGITEGELALLQTRYDELMDGQDGAALEAFYAAHEAKLAELGVTADSSDEDLLEALEVLAGTEGNTEEDQQHYDAQIAIVGERIAAANLVAFTAEEDGAQYGIATKGGQPLPEGVYEHEGKRYQVTGAEGRYTELHADEQGHDPKAPQVHFFGEGEMSMTFTPNADDVTKGTVAWQDGTKVKAGTYTSATGVNIAVQVGSKASIK